LPCIYLPNTTTHTTFRVKDSLPKEAQYVNIPAQHLTSDISPIYPVTIHQLPAASATLPMQKIYYAKKTEKFSIFLSELRSLSVAIIGLSKSSFAGFSINPT